ncbi:MAG: hypothetical protein JRE36_08220, partial [Deltaproteobacteria bacterium]|nr:hypothetical protein [Deltaproteobacteria bacterium]
PDIQKYMERTGRPLPKLLDYGDIPDRPAADIPVILKADFLAEETLYGESFNCIIGNPPWEGRQSKLSAQKYLQKAPLLLKEGGTGCLLLPVKILQNQTDAFQAEWLTQVTMESVLQLADYSFLLFQNALCPAFIARFKNMPPQLAQHLVEFAAPKFNRAGLRQGVVTINPSSRTWLQLDDILAATQSKTAPVVWKRRLWGTSRDQKLLDLLQSLPPLSDLAGKPKENKRWIKGQGFQPNTSGKSKNPKRPWWEKTELFISARASCWASKCIQVYIEDCEEISDRFPSLHRTRDKRLYKAPMVLVSQGFGKIAFCEFDVLFQDSLQSIAGPQEDTDLLIFLTVYLRSKLARYFLFHTSANWGSERDKVHLSELLRVPFPLPGHEFVSPEAGQIVKQVSQKFGKLCTRLQDTLNDLKTNARRSSLFGDDVDISKQWQRERKRQIDALQSELEPLIYCYFGLTEQEITLVEDTNEVFEPSSTPTTWNTPKTVTLDPLEKTKIEPYASQALGAYANTLTKTLNTWAEAESSSLRVHAEGGSDEQTGLTMVTVSLSSTDRPFQQKPISRNLAKKLKNFHRLAQIDHGTLIYQRDILLFQDRQIHIVRPNILLNWTRTAALNDAARIYGEIALAHEEF